MKKTSGTVTTLNYYGQPVQLIGKFHSDLSTSDVPIFSGITIKIVFSLNKSPFLVQTDDADASYVLKLKEMFLHVPLGILAPSVYSSIEHQLATSNIVIHYKRCAISIHEINSGSLEYRTNNLFLK